MSFGIVDNEPLDLARQGVVLTGGTTGIGRATARRLLADGAHVLVCGRHEPELRDALDDLSRAGSGKVFGLIADTSQPDDVRHLFLEADRLLEGVDVLINNAAIRGGSIVDTDYDEWRHVVHTNLLGYLSCCRAALDRMLPRGGGQIVNVGSMSAKVREKGSDLYVATKSAIEGFSEALRKQVNARGVRVTLIEPGLVGSDMTAESTPPERQPEKIEAGAMLRAEDIAECIRYALIQPRRCDVVQVQIRPIHQAI